MTGAATGEPPPVIVGQVVAVHGVRGQVRAAVLSDVPHRFNQGQTLHIGGNSYTVASSQRNSPQLVVLKFCGVDSLQEARGLVGQEITVPQSAVPDLPQGEYFHFQLLGLRVVTEDGEELGHLGEILETGSNDVYVVSGTAGELLIPALEEVVLEVRLGQGTMVVRLPDGLR